MKDLITYMGYEWIMIEDGVLTIGSNEAGLVDLEPASSRRLLPLTASIGARDAARVRASVKPNRRAEVNAFHPDMIRMKRVRTPTAAPTSRRAGSRCKSRR